MELSLFDLQIGGGLVRRVMDGKWMVEGGIVL